VLTKPLGSQIAANLALWLGDEKKWQKASAVIDLDTALQAVQSLVLSFKVGTVFCYGKTSH
jgi:Flp pilus assembly protein TadD